MGVYMRCMVGTEQNAADKKWGISGMAVDVYYKSSPV
jgi:hypothetical protein